MGTETGAQSVSMEQMDSNPIPPDEQESRGSSARLSPSEIDALWREHRRWVAAVILAHMPRDSDLEDLLQDVALLMVRSIHTLNDINAIRPWLRTIAINSSRSAARKRKVRMRIVHETEDPDTISGAKTGSIATEKDRQARLERGRRLMDAAQTLPPAYREPLLLRCVRGMSQKQVADVLDLPETTIETRLVRARRMIREQIDREDASQRAIATDPLIQAGPAQR